MPRSKSATTCSQCRSRKVKCDGGPNPCSNCERLEFDCSFGLQSIAPAKPEKRRGSRACYQCRTHKSKCSGELPACASCRARMKDCVYPESTRSPRSKTIYSASTIIASPDEPANDEPLPALTRLEPDAVNLEASSSLMNQQLPPTPSTGIFLSHGGDPVPCLDTDTIPLPLPSISGQLHLITDFFRHLHPLPPFSFLHEVSVTQRCLSKSLDEALLHAICAITALHMGYRKYYPVSTAAWIRRAEQIIWSELEKPSIFRIQALILINLYHVEVGSFQRAFMLLSFAARGASALRLQYERLDLGHLAKEIRRRLVWCLALQDGLFAIGLSECEVWPVESIHLEFPCREEDFHAEPNEAQDALLGDHSLDGVAENGLLTTFIRELFIRRDGIIFMRQVRLATEPMPFLGDLVDEFIDRLQQLNVAAYSQHEFRRFARSRWHMRYIAVHLSWHQAHCDIYRLFLSGYREAAPAAVISGLSPEYIARAAQLCYQHAQIMIEILTDLDELRPRPIVVHNDLAICGYHACRLILFLSRSPLIPEESRMESQAACDKARMILSLLKEVYPFSTIVSHLRRDLETVIQQHLNGNSGDDAQGQTCNQDTILDGDSTQPRFAMAAQRQRFLGVHSLLRQSRFRDETPEIADSVQDSSLTPASSQAQSHAFGTSSNMEAQYSQSALADLTQVAGGSTLESMGGSRLLESMFVPALANAGNVPCNPGAWDIWNDCFWTNNISPGFDTDYL